MRTLNYAPWEHYPKNLRQHEIADPMSVINDFFNANTVKGHRKRLNEWRYYVVNDEHFKDKRDGPGTLLFIYDLNVKLLEALYLKLYAHKACLYKRSSIDEAQLKVEKANWAYYPKNLSRKEQLDPYKVIDKAFKKVKPQQYRDHLQEWLGLALYTISDQDVLDAEDIITLYEQLLKLYSAAWLISQREGGHTEFRLRKIQSIPAVSSNDQVSIFSINPYPTVSEKLSLVELKKTIVKRCPTVQLISHLGVHPEPFTFYLLIVVSDEENRPEHEIRNKIEDNCRYLAHVHAIVHKINSARQALTAGNQFWSNVMQKGFVVFQESELGLPQSQVMTNELLTANAKSIWSRWGKQGNDFLKGAEAYRTNGNLRLAVFLLHQSVESTFLAIIRALIGYELKMHNLSRLLELSKLVTDGLADVFKNETTEDKLLFALLQDAYAHSRYSLDFDPAKQQVTLLFSKVAEFNRAGENIYRQYLAELGSA